LAGEQAQSASAARYRWNQRYFVATGQAVVSHGILVIDGDEERSRQPLRTRQGSNVIYEIAHRRTGRQLECDAIIAERVGVRCEEQDSYGHRT
jgi:hypothetical protein